MAPEEKSTIKLSGLRKTAVLLVSLARDQAATIMGLMEKDDIERVSLAIAEIEEVPSEERDQVLEEFCHLSIAQKYVSQGGLTYAQSLLERCLPKEEADAIVAMLEQTISRTPFSFLQRAESENLLTFIQNEHPQTIALIMSHLNAAKASEVLSGLPQVKQLEVVKRVASMEQTNPEVIKQVERGLENRLASMLTREYQEAGGIPAVAEILNLADRATEKAILETLEEEDPELVDEIRKRMFVFEDIILVNEKGIQSLLKEVDNAELALAMRTASDELKEKIFGNMSERAAGLIQEEMEYMGPVRVSDVETAQQAIVDIVRRLEEAGDIVVAGRGGEEGVVV